MSFPNVFSKNLSINFLLYLIPVTNIIGNLALNLNIVLLILFVFLFYGVKVFPLKYNLSINWYVFFYLCIFKWCSNNFLNFDFPTATDENLVLIKSFSFLRYLVLYLL